MRRLAMIGAALALAAGVGVVPAEAAKVPVQKVFQFEPHSETSVGEGGAADIAISRTYTKGPASVDVVITSGETTTATAGADFVAETVTVTFKAGVQYGLIFDATTIQDSIPEGDETFVLYFDNESKGYAVGGDSVVTIVDDDD